MAGNNMCMIVTKENTWRFLDPGIRSQQSYFVACMPDELLLMSNLEQIDLDSDGWWNWTEAGLLTDDYTSTVGRYVNLEKVFREVASTIFTQLILERRQLLESKSTEQQLQGLLGLGSAGAAGCSDLQCLQNDLTSFSFNMSYLQSRVAPLLKVCLLLDSRLCDNMILRGSWAKHLTQVEDWQGLTRELAVALGLTGLPPLFQIEGGEDLDRNSCKLILQDFCLKIGTKQTELWTMRKDEFCETASTIAYDFQGRWGNRVSFSGSTAYVGPLGTSNALFIFFNMLILFLWDLAVTAELQTLVAWYLVLLQSPSTGEKVSFRDDEIIINAIPRRHRWNTLLFNLLPRTAITLAMIGCGVQYLLSMNTVEDLVLNALGLTFLMTVDDMLFFAFSSVEHKAWMRRFKIIEVQLPDFFCNHWMSAEFRCLQIIIFLFVAAFTHLGCKMFILIVDPCK